MKNNIEVNATYIFGNITVVEKTMNWKGSKWHYTISGTGPKYILAHLSNFSGHLLALPLAEEFRNNYTIIALSVPPIQSFSDTAIGLKMILDSEGINTCYAIGQSNGGVHLQNLIAKFPDTIEKVVFSHSLTSMDRNDAYSINASEVRIYRIMRKLLKFIPISIFTFALKQTVLPKLYLQSGKTDSKQLSILCKRDLKKLTKKDFLIMADCMEDFLFNHTFSEKPYKQNPQNVLIVDSPSDKVVNPMQREQMLKLCPNAQEYHFKTGGHVTIVNCRDEYFSLLHRFWG